MTPVPNAVLALFSALLFLPYADLSGGFARPLPIIATQPCFDESLLTPHCLCNVLPYFDGPTRPYAFSVDELYGIPGSCDQDPCTSMVIGCRVARLSFTILNTSGTELHLQVYLGSDLNSLTGNEIDLEDGSEVTFYVGTGDTSHLVEEDCGDPYGRILVYTNTQGEGAGWRCGGCGEG